MEIVDLKDLRRRVLALLEDNHPGLTTSELAGWLSLNRMIMAKYLGMLQLMGAVKERRARACQFNIKINSSTTQR